MITKRDKIIAYTALGVSVICFLLVCCGVYGYTGPVNITSIGPANDTRVNPSDPVTWPIGPVYNGTTGNPVQNGFGMQFDGIGDLIDCGSGASLDNMIQFSFECWFRKTGPNGQYLSKRHKYFEINNDGQITAWVNAPGGSGVSTSNVGAVLNNTLYHFVMIYDNTTLRYPRIFLNGTEITYLANTAAIGPLNDDNAEPFVIGRRRLAVGNWFIGFMDEVRVYNRTIGSGEIAYSYQNKVPLNQMGLVLWIDLDTNVQDQTPNGNDGSITGTPVYVRGIRGKADMIFDGTGDNINCGNDASLNITEDLSIGFWMKSFDSVTNQYLICKGSSRYAVLLGFGNGYVGFFASGYAGDNPSQFSFIQVPDDDLHHYFITYNKSGTVLRGYRDGLEVATPITADTTFATDALDLYIGSSNVADWANVTLDEFELYNRTLTTTEVWEHYQGIIQNENGRVLYLDFDGQVNDQSGNGNNGTPSGDPEFGDGWAFCPLTSSYNGTDSTTVSLVNSTTGLATLYDTAPATHGTYTVTVYPPTLLSVLNGTFTGFIVDLYNIDVHALYTEVEAGFQTLIYANGSSVIDGHTLTDGDTLVIEGVTLTWNEYMNRFEATDTEATATIKTYDTLTTLLETTYGITNGNISTPVTVIWTTPSLDLIMPFMRAGDWPGVIIEINILLMGETLFWTLLMASISMAIYNYSGAETAIAAWILGWGIFSPVIHGEAVTISLIMIALAGGIYIAKFFLDRRTSV